MQENKEIDKSSRHSKIIGDYGEALICNWLSRSGFEVIMVDHTGIDIIAYHPKTKERLGITVKSRTRPKKREFASVHILRKENEDAKKVLQACKAFACIPWVAIYVEAEKYAEAYLTSLQHFNSKYNKPKGRQIASWNMTIKMKDKYLKDKKVKHIRFDFSDSNWN